MMIFFINFFVIFRAQLFSANNDSSTEVTHDFALVFAAQHIRFHPTDFHSHMSMRVGVTGCTFHNTGFICACDDGWLNADVTSLVTSCSSNVCATQFSSGENVTCENIGNCLDSFDSTDQTFCECQTGFTGPFCNYGTPLFQTFAIV